MDPETVVGADSATLVGAGQGTTCHEDGSAQTGGGELCVTLADLLCRTVGLDPEALVDPDPETSVGVGCGMPVGVAAEK
jgi:hypothetical protein